MAVSNRSARARNAVLSVCVLAAVQSMALGGINFTSGSAKWTFDADTNGGDQQKSINVGPPASGSMPAPPTYQLKQKYTSGNSTASAFGSIGYIANATTATFTLAPGSGVQQSDPNNAAYPGDSLVRVDFDGLFTPTAPGFGPPATGYVSIAVGGIVGAGGHSQFTGQVDFLNGNNSAAAPFRPTVKFDKTFNSAGTFAQTFTSSALLNPSTIPTGTPLRVKGFFEFRAANDASPSSILPVDIEFGGAPPTATWYSTDSTQWGNAANWRPPGNAVIDDPDQTIPSVPNGPGQRAKFVSFGNVTRNVNLDQDITVGALDINASGSFSIANSGSISHVLNLKTGYEGEGGPSTIHARNLFGDSDQSISVPVQFDSELQIVTDGLYQGPGAPKPAATVSFLDSITSFGTGGIRKLGRGTARFNAANDFTGGATISGGRLEANVADSLGSGDVLVDNGLLAYNAVHAARAGALIQADNGGQIDLGVTPASNERFNIGSYGILSGSPAQLASLDASNEGNLRLTPGATIAHESFDATLTEGNPRLLGANGAQYIFGIASDYNSDVGPQKLITIGSESGTPWKGFGSDRFDRYFGTDPRTDHEIIQVAGIAELRSLDQTLVINGQLNSIVGTSSLTKTGMGAVALNNINNNFRAPITVKEGKLLVNGFVYGVTQLTVADGATFGGAGNLDGPVALKDGATIAPGDNTLTGHVGTLKTGSLELSELAQLEFELNDAGVEGNGINDLLMVNGNLTLDGILNIIDDGNFGPGEYRLIEFSGILTDNGLTLGYVPDDGLTYKLSVVPGGFSGGALQLTVVPEPASIVGIASVFALSQLRRRRR